jgi:subtilisin family serine protease
VHARLRTAIAQSAQRLGVLGACALLALSGGAVRAAEPVRPPRVIRGSGPPPPALAPGDEKLDSGLRALVAPEPLPAVQSPTLVPLPVTGMRGAEAHVYVRVDSASDDDLAHLAEAGLRADRVSLEHGLVRGWLDAADLRRLASVGVVRSITPVRPGVLRALVPDTAGDNAARGPQARATGFDGTGVKVGVISDGVDHLASIGDMPAGTGVPAGAGCRAGSGDEGTAILEIVHDLAPGATLVFSQGLSDKLGFIDSVNCLRNAGAQVIVDDIGFFDEPYFEDGMVAQAVRAAVQAGVSYHSSAGNEAGIHYGGLFQPIVGSAYHNFASGTPDTFDDVAVPSGAGVDCILEWSSPFETAVDNYDLELWDTSVNPPTLVTSSNNAQPGTPAIEEVGAFNFGPGTAHAGIAIKRVSGTTRQLSMFCLGVSSGALQYVTPQGSIIGHPAIREAVAVGAIDVHDPGLDTVEAFSSEGPVTVFFPQDTRPKPDLAGFDGVSTEVSGFSPFFGTSAAAPHSAAVAALLLSKNSCRTPAQIQQTLKATADDIGAAGFDPVSGAGRLDALGAIQAVPVKECTVNADCNDGDVCTTDTCEGCTCVHRAISCDDGDPCTADTCDSHTGCQHVVVPDDTPCPDTNLCNGTETCQAGTCTPGTALVCDDGSLCTADTCEPATGCVFLDACDDRNPCTTDTCDPLAGCGHTAVTDGTPCPDANLCDGTETCRAGTCTPGAPLVCDDGDGCSADTCDPRIGCTYPPIDGFAGIACLCGRGLGASSCGSVAAPAGIAGRFGRACKLIARASSVRNPRRARRLVLEAAQTLGKARRVAAKVSTHLPPGCAPALMGVIDDTRARAGRLAGRL